jgi:hypothetical protein
MATAFNPTIFQPTSQPNYGITPVAGTVAQSNNGLTQLNDLINYQKNQALQQAQIQAGIAASQQAQTQAQQAAQNLSVSQEDYARRLVNGVQNMSELQPDDKGNYDPSAWKATIKMLRNSAEAAGLPQHPSNVLGQLEDAVDNGDYKTASTLLKVGGQTSGSLSEQYAANLPTLTTAGGQPALFNRASGQVTPVGGLANQQQTTQQTTQQPTAQEPVPELSQPAQMQYPVRVAGQPFAASPSEEKDKEEGNKYRSGLVTRQSLLTTDRRNIDEVIKTANELEKSWAPTSGILGSAYRHVATWAGDPTYKQLSKDLANVQMANIRAQGGSLDTVAGQQLAKMANGDETYPPSVLMSIAARAKADMTNIDMQATASQKFANKFGDNNMKSFQQMWSKNADSKVFEVMNVAKDSNLSAEEKKKIVDNLLGKDSEQRKIFNQKYQNIIKLEKNGTL